MIDVHATLTALARLRPVFHSEADFQHAFAWLLHMSRPEAAVRLERPVHTPGKVMHVDLVATERNHLFLCELKYKTRALQGEFGGERYSLQSHAAQPIGRYDFLTDVARLESLRQAVPATCCWAIMLTNDTPYWTAAGAPDGISAAFSLAPGRKCSGLLEWGPSTSPGTRKARDKVISIADQYCLEWRDYSNLGVPRGTFRYLAVEVHALSAS